MTWPLWLCRLVPYLGRRQADADIEEELRLHLDLERERQREAGAVDSDARRAARRTLGNAALIRERTRDVWGWRWLDDLGGHLRHAVRGLRRSPGFAAIVVTLLALGIGASTATFSVVYGILIRPLPYPEPERIVSVRGLTNVTFPALRDDTRTFEHLAAYGLPRRFTWRGPSGSHALRGWEVSPSFFSGVYGIAPHLGRFFTEDEAVAGAHRVVVLSFHAWRDRFGSDPDVIGTPLELEGAPYTVVGVLPRRFSAPSRGMEVWTPLVVAPYDQTNPADPSMTIRMTTPMFALGRVRDGVSSQQATIEARVVVRRARFEVAGDAGPRVGREVEVVPLQQELVRASRPILLLVATATALVVLIACVNVAGLFLARGITRRRESAMRAALGAGRGRVARLLLTESVVLSLVGGAVGLAVAVIVVRAVPALVPGYAPRLDEVDVDGTAAAFATGLSVLIGLLSGMAPALRWSRTDLLGDLQQGGQATGGVQVRGGRARAALVALQVAVTVTLLVSATMLLRSFVQLVTVDPGFDRTRVLTARVGNASDLRESSLDRGPTWGEMVDTGAINRRFYDALIQSVERLPGVVAVGLIGGGPETVPLLFTQHTIVRRADRPSSRELSDNPRAHERVVTPGYFDAMRLRLRQGRFLTPLDTEDGPSVVVINEVLGRLLFGDASAVGRRVLFRGGAEAEVVGVVADLKHPGTEAAGAFADVASADGGASASAPEIYMPLAQDLLGTLYWPVLLVRTAADPRAIAPTLRETVSEVNPTVPIYDVLTLEERLSAAVATPRLYASLVGSYAAVALFLALFGIYGLLSRTVFERLGEIGIRRAMGARRSAIVALVVRQGAWLVVVGLAVGTLGAVVATRLLESFLFGVTPNDLVSFAAAVLAVAVVSVAACWLPARRAARVNPMDSLRAG
ncbi:MAG: ABC transporter permease [Acidobacteria bacterium]|nr:ABC transporter permease [Acidobacteriota bacterium]